MLPLNFRFACSIGDSIFYTFIRETMLSLFFILKSDQFCQFPSFVYCIDLHVIFTDNAQLEIMNFHIELIKSLNRVSL